MGLRAEQKRVLRRAAAGHRMTMPNFDVIIVGGGPAGLNAALVLARARRRVLVCDDGQPRNAPSHAMHGYLTRDGVAPRELLRLAREEVERYGVEFLHATVVDARCQAGVEIEVVLADGRLLTGRKLLLATGVKDVVPDVPGVRDFYGTSIHHCPYCDGYEWRDQPIAAYGDEARGVGLALALLNWSPDLVVCTDDGAPPGRRDRQRLRRFNIRLRTEKIARFEGADGKLERIVFDSGPDETVSAMFFNTGQAQRSPLAEKLGCRFDRRGHVCTDRKGRTGVCNLFLAGDANGDVQFVIVAAAEGAQAAVAINRELQEEDRARHQRRPMEARARPERRRRHSIPVEAIAADQPA